MENRDIWFRIVPHLTIFDLFNFRKANKTFHARFSSENFWSDLLGTFGVDSSKSEIESFNFGRIDPILKYAKLLLEYKIAVLPGVEKIVDLTTAAKLSGLIGDSNNVKYFHSKRAYKPLAYGLAKSGRINLLRELGLDSKSKPENNFAILSGLAGYGNLQLVQAIAKRCTINKESPLEPLYEALAHKSIFIYLFELYISKNAIPDPNSLFSYGFKAKYFESCDYLIHKFGGSVVTAGVILDINDKYHIAYYCKIKQPIEALLDLITYGKIDQFILENLEYEKNKQKLLELAKIEDNTRVLKYMIDKGLQINNIDLLDAKGGWIKLLAKNKHSQVIPNLDLYFKEYGTEFCWGLMLNYAKTSKAVDGLISQHPQIKTLKAFKVRIKSNEW